MTFKEETFEAEIDIIIEERIAKYRKKDGETDDDEITATFNREKETIDGYNGRQLLELIQNADDAQSDQVLVELNTQEQTLIIANKGDNCEPFSVAGIKSLLLANLSPKISNDYIGNKGLGFRSIINWSDKITINTRNVDIAFSQDIAVEKFKNSDLEKTKLPILAIPEVSEKLQKDWVTRIEIKYKHGFLDDIKEQIKQLNPEILLFLNHLKVIRLIVDNEEEKIDKPKLWEIKSKTGEFPKNLLDNDDIKTKYELKIAFNDELSQPPSEYLFSYFPTNIKISMPFIVHGTFDLDSTRNQLNTTDKNKFILTKLVELIVETAKKLTENEVSYKALEFLNYSHKNEILDKLEFYQKINSAVAELEIYPCVDDKYRKKADIVYNNNFSKFIQDNNFVSDIPCLLKPTEIQQKLLEKLKLDAFNTINHKGIESVNKKIDKNIIRIAFICHLIDNDYKKQLSLLVDETNVLISSGDIYTPANLDFLLPDYVHIQFVNKNLYDELSEKIKGDLVEKLKYIVNIKNYNKVEILRKVITSTNKELEAEDADTIDLVQSMLKCLYKNYSDAITISDQNISLLDKGRQLQKAKNLYLSKTYPSGELTEKLFDQVFTDNDFLADIDTFSLGDNIQKIEEFFLWLGVNKNTRLDEYRGKYFGSAKTEYNQYDPSKQIYLFEKINNISVEKLVLWCLKSKDIEDEIDKEYQLENIGARGGRYPIDEIGRSHILYQLGKFKDYLISDNNAINNLVNDKCINYKYQLFTENKIHKANIDSLLLKLGAVEKLGELSADKTQAMLRSLPEKDSKGKLAQKIYIEIFKSHKKNIDNNVDLFAKKKGEVAYFSHEEVHYAGRVKLPKEYADTLAIFDYPKKNEATNITNFFQIKNLSDVQRNISNKEISDINDEFQKYFTTIKPYVLTYRIENLNRDEDKRKEAEKINTLDIKLCKKISCKINDKQYELSDYDYLFDDQCYLIKTPDEALIDIRQNYDLYTTFGDIIGLVFSWENTDKFKNCIKDNDVNIERDIKDHIGSNAINESRELLGISSDFYNFWHTIYGLKGKDYTDYNNNLALISQDIGFDVKDSEIKYEDLTNLKNAEAIISIFEALKITIKDFNQYAENEIDLSVFHQGKLRGYFNDNERNFKRCLHQYCLDNSKEEKFLTKFRQYHQVPNINAKEQLKANYQDELNEFIKKEFKFELKAMDEQDIDLIYTKNKEELGDFFEDIENIESIRSLLYFEYSVDKVREKVRGLKREKEEQKASTENQVKNSSTVKEIREAELITISANQTTKYRSSNQTYSYHQQQQQRKKAGNQAENEVYHSLVDKYGKEKVIWVAETEPNANHDLKYQDEYDKWWYVEVKTMSNNKFFISKNEKEFAEQNQDKYQIFLVGDEIKKISFANFNELPIEATDFVVHYQLTEG